MLKRIDSFLNNVTMYRLVMYYLIALLGIAGVADILGFLHFDIFAYLLTVAFLVCVGAAANELFARTFKVAANVESIYISTLILALIITPIKSLADLPFLFWAAVWTAASKFIFARNRKHFFNPVGIAMVIIAFTIHHSASWWVGSAPLMPFVLMGGLLIVRKIRRVDLVFSFTFTALTTVVFFGMLKSQDPLSMISRALLDTPLLFFAFIMITEPLTTPPTRQTQVWYGMLVGFLFAPQQHLGSIYTTPELALVIGNVASYLMSPKAKLLLTLKEKIPLCDDLYDFVFTSDHSLPFTPGQYLEWTLPHEHPDNRGNRRYFTIASSPTEDTLRMGVKFYSPASTYKQKLLAMNPGDTIIAAQLAGDFTLPKDRSEKLVFIAGGIGITPFRSMLKYLIDNHEKRDIVLFFANKTQNEICYQDVFDQAGKELGIKCLYALSDTTKLPPNWTGITGRVTADMMKKEVPDYKDRLYYLSGPHAMVMGFEEVLKSMGIPSSQVITDYFPGFV